MRNNRSHFLQQMSPPMTPRSPSASSPSSSYDSKTLSPRLRFPHLYPTLQFPLTVSPRYNNYPTNQPSGSPVYAFPYVPTGNSWPLANYNPSPRAYQLSPRGVVYPYPSALLWPSSSPRPSPRRVVYPYPSATTWPSSSPRPSPLGVSPRHLNIGRRFGLVPATPRSRAVEEDAAQQWWPSTVELVGRLSVSCNDGAHETRGIGPVDEPTPRRMERFKIRTVDLEEMIVKDDEKKK